MWQTGLTPHGWLNSLLFHLGILDEGQKIFWLGGYDATKARLLAIIILVDAWTVIPHDDYFVSGFAKYPQGS